MRRDGARRRGRREQEGYALVLVVFLLALIVIATAAMAPNIITNGRREREEEMIWRGKQYVRGIRLYVRYYQTHGGTTRFPTAMEDLTKNKVGIRFMRQAYKDPVNAVDGSWRMIYVGPNGQLIGSLKSRPLLTDGQSSGFLGNSSGGVGSSFGGTPAGSNSSFGASSFGNSTSANSSFGGSSFNNGGNANANAATAQGQAAGQGTQSGLSSDTMSTPQAITSADGATELLGGNIIGVGSKVNKASIIWYDKAKNYRQFEFIWDPSKEPVNGGAAAGVIGVPPAGTQNGQNGIFGNQGGNTGFGQQAPGGITGNPNPGGTNPPLGQTPPGQSPQ